MPRKSVDRPIIIGVDPGKSGGCVGLNTAGVTWIDFQHTDLEIVDYIQSFSDPKRKVICYVEKVHAMPKQGVASSFNFGERYGFIKGVVQGNFFPIELVTPQRWQKYFEVKPSKTFASKTKFKDHLREKAQNLFPDLQLWKQTLTQQRAICDALLIAEYGRRTYG